MAQKNKNIKTKTTKKVNKTAAPAAAPAEPAVVETVAVEDPKVEKTVNPTDISTKNLAGTTSSKLDANHRVDLLKLADGIFRQDPNADNRFT